MLWTLPSGATICGGGKEPKDRPSGGPRYFLGPVIDAAAHARITGYIDLGKREGRCRLEMEAPKEGYYIGPAIFSHIEPQHRRLGVNLGYGDRGVL